MALTRPKGSKIYVMDFMFHGQRIRETTGMSSITRAREVQAKRKQALRDGSAGIRKALAPRLLSTAAEDWTDAKKVTWSASMCSVANHALAHLLPVLGRKLVVDIEATDVSKYQKTRLKQGASNGTVNIEVKALRQIMIKCRAWERIKPDVVMLPEREDVGRALTPDEESMLLYECGQSRSRILLPFVTLALETGARFDTIRTLQWSNIDFANRCLKFGKDKTAAGTGRTIPLNQRAIETLTFWAQNFPKRLPHHYVFPCEACRQSGTEETFGFTGSPVYDTDPLQPIGDIKTAWETAKRRTKRQCPSCKNGVVVDKKESDKGFICEACHLEFDELPAGVNVRFHDLRHTAVSRMVAARVPLPIIAKIVGWSTGTMAKMAARYGHFAMEELRGAAEAMSAPKIEAGSPQIPPQSEVKNLGSKPN